MLLPVLVLRFRSRCLEIVPADWWTRRSGRGQSDLSVIQGTKLLQGERNPEPNFLSPSRADEAVEAS